MAAPPRREMILGAAIRLFHERGFHAVGVDDIGQAAGITGPGVYRHFAGKDELLVAALREVAQRMWDALDDRAADTPWQTLEAYVRSHVELALEHAEVIGLWYSEQGSLPADARVQQRRLQRRYAERWVEALLAARPELTPAEARVRVHASFGLIHSVVHLGPSDPGLAGEVLVRMDLAALAA